MNKITDITRQDIFDIIKDGFTERSDEPLFDDGSVTGKKIYMPFYGRLDEIKFFSRLYDLKTMPSRDSRYHDALGDISCHLGWGDYEDCWFFQDERFKLQQKDGDEPILKFLCEMFHPAVRDEKSPWKSYLEKFNELLHVDGYEIYAVGQVSGRDIYGVRDYYLGSEPHLPESLFSERYKELISYGDGMPIDNISGGVEHIVKKRLSKIMLKHMEPQRIRRSRYDSWIDDTDALKEAVDHLNEYMDFTVIDYPPKDIFFDPEELFANAFTPFLFDVIEFQYDELSKGEKTNFQEGINDIFRFNNTPFYLSDKGIIELQNGQEILTPEIAKSIEAISEPGIKDLLQEAIEKHMQPSLQAHRDAVEKIWDAFERLKTYYTNLDKRSSAIKIVEDMAGNNTDYIKLFDVEFKALTEIGNDYRIRHHETNKIDIIDPNYYDYFFNRCLSLIGLAIKYLE